MQFCRLLTKRDAPSLGLFKCHFTSPCMLMLKIVSPKSLLIRSTVVGWCTRMLKELPTVYPGPVLTRFTPVIVPLLLTLKVVLLMMQSFSKNL